MPSLDPRRRAPRLLAVVYVVSLVLVAFTAVALTTVVSNDVRDTAIGSSVQADRSLVLAFAEANLTPAELLQPNALTPDRIAQVEGQMQVLVRNGLFRIKVFDKSGTVLLADKAQLRGDNFGLEDDLQDALAGIPHSDLKTDFSDEEPDLIGHGPAIEEYLPVSFGDGPVVAVFEVYRDAGAIIAQIDKTTREVLLMTGAAGAILAFLLYFLFRGADRRLKRQTAELLESTRRDALTGLFTHGAIVARLNAEMERAAPGESVGLALIDVDNFRGLNDTHGHDPGDQVLREVARTLRSEMSEETAIGRYGPDEFLVVTPASCIHDLGPAVERLRTRLVAFGPRFGDSEHLPVTVSVGLAAYPRHGRAATELLSLATQALQQAKQGGGDKVRLAEPMPEASDVRKSFDILQGLVIAVDTKDNYTKRHSDDVARYAVFLADRLGLPAAVRRTLHVAGRLHDVGKIGIPDQILRKPGKLTPDEYSVVKQHVALGYMIVRDLPDLDQVRLGIRHHHEQWNGTGYLDGLAGTEIPLIARILAVADAFSAMTTTRPYRKALSVKEALVRLEDASDSQLDPTLVAAFVHGMSTAQNAPMPAESPTAPARLWTPRSVVQPLPGITPNRFPPPAPGAAIPAAAFRAN